MAINDKLIIPEAAGGGGGGTGNQEEGLQLLLDANDVDSYDGDGDIWYDITNFEYTPATNVSEHFNTVLYTGSGAVTGVGFEPDLVWIKDRTLSYSHQLHDTVRGVGQRLFSSNTNGQSYSSTSLQSFDSDGFTVGNNNGVGRSGDDHVAWCFKAGGAPSGSDKVSIDGTSYSTMSAANLTNGTISVDKLSVNTNLGFSIVSYNGNQVSNATVAHGLGVNPELIIVKNLESAVSWGVWTTGISDSQVLRLEQTSAAGTPATAYFEPQNNTSNFFSLGTNDETNHNDDYIAYCFASKRGVSKVGSYTGDGGTSNKVYTGFEPAFVLQKRTDIFGTSDWRIFDNVRGTEKELYANSNAVEPSDVAYIDFNRDGFTLTNNGGWINGNTNKYIYYAIAKDTNETSLIPDTNLELGLDAGTYSGSGNWLDSSGNGNNGTITGATWDRELGNSFEFVAPKGNSKITVPTSTDFNHSSGGTYEGWVYLNSVSTGNETFFSRVVSSTGKGLHIFWLPAYGFIVRDFNTSGTEIIDQNNIKTGATGFERGKWYHIAVSISSSSSALYTLYVNGEFIDSATAASGTQVGISEDISIGYYATGGSSDLKGNIGQFRMYSTVLSLTQVRQNFNFTKPRYPNGNDAALTNMTSSNWNSGGYFTLNGSNEDFAIGYNAFQNTNAMTVCGWVYVSNFTSFRSIFAIRSLASATVKMLVAINTDKTIRFDSASTSGFLTLGVSSVANGIPSGQWVHIASIIDYGTKEFKLYKNKTLAITGTNSNIRAGNDFGITTFRLGSNKQAQYFMGDTSKFRVYDKVLSQAEIDALVDEGE